MKIELTANQCRNVSEFIEHNIFDEIRKDVDIDNIEWLRDMLDAHKALLEAAVDEND